ncbi:MAG TPA: hypothetical protein VLY23_14855 [Candidatus Acidoferrum sp.]|nr:hypothetical protein [Candidatus Acidoferrum sp.]
MKRVVFLAVVFLLFSFNLQAQENSQNSPLFSSSFGNAANQLEPPTTFSVDTPFAATPSLHLLPSSQPAAGASGPAASAPASPAPRQLVYGVMPKYDFQAYLGYTFIRFYEVPGVNVNLHGFNYSIVFYPEYFKGWIGADGEFVAAFGTQNNESARFLLGMGGARFRWSLPRGLEFWAHGLVGGSHYVPQTSYGGQGALGYEVGGGVDINSHNSRFAYRISADAVGTEYFSTYQFSPKVAVGIVYKF